MGCTAGVRCKPLFREALWLLQNFTCPIFLVLLQASELSRTGWWAGFWWWAAAFGGQAATHKCGCASVGGQLAHNTSPLLTTTPVTRQCIIWVSSLPREMSDWSCENLGAEDFLQCKENLKKKAVSRDCDQNRCTSNLEKGGNCFEVIFFSLW